MNEPSIDEMIKQLEEMLEEGTNNIKEKQKQKDDPVEAFDRAMRGI